MCRPQSAFTLLETIIAMTLMSLLLAIVWTMFSVYTKLETKGRRVVSEARLARAIDRQLRYDLLHIVAIDPSSIDDVENSPDADRTTETSPKKDRTRPSDSIHGYFYGTTNEISFVVSSGGPESEALPELRVISYQPRLGPSSNADNATGRMEAEAAEVSDLDSSPKYETDPQGMMDGMDRHDRSWSSYWENSRINESNSPLLSTNRPITLDDDDLIQLGSAARGDEDDDQRLWVGEDKVDEIPELKRVRFRYFDGTKWQEAWDSESEGRLPIALEIEFDLHLGGQPSLANRSLPDSAPVPGDRLSVGNAEITETSHKSEYRLTVAIAAAIQGTPADGSSQPTNGISDVLGGLP